MGYIGLPTALMLAAHGTDVVGVDRSQALLATLHAGKATFQENGLDDLFAAAREKGVVFTDAYPRADVYIIAVATPYDPKTRRINPAHVSAAVRDVLGVCPEGAVVVVESTVSPGTIDHEIRPLLRAAGRQPGADIHLAHAPERIIPGNMIHELVHNSRTIGADEPETGERIREMYRTFCRGEIVLTDIRTAEMSKVVENTYRDINIAFANELAKICRMGGMDVHEVIRIANLHPRVNILQPGPGVGGHCISVDPWFLVGDYPWEAKLIRAAREVNDSMPAFVLGRIRGIMAARGLTDFARVGLYGLTYKENVDDVRESPTLQLMGLMEAEGIRGIQVYDPFVKNRIADGQHESLEGFLAACDLVTVMVGHSQIREKPEALRHKIVLDTRRLPELAGAETL